MAFAVAFLLENGQNKDILVGVEPNQVLVKLPEEILVIPEKYIFLKNINFENGFHV